MKKLNYIILTILALTLFFSCEQEDILFTEDMANVGFHGSSASMLEVDKEMKGKDTLTVQILVTATLNSPSCDVSYEVDNTWYQEINGLYYEIADGDTAQVNPAIEGTDFNILSDKTVTVTQGYGYAPVVIAAIDNNNYDPLGNKSFRLRVTDNSQGYDLSSEAVMTITIVDDDHPLGWMLGEYMANVTQTANGNSQYKLTIEAVEGETDKVKIYGMCGPSYGPGSIDPYVILGTVSEDYTTLTIKSGQSWDDWNYGPVSLTVWEDDYGDGEEVDDLVGAISTDGGVSITFNQAFTFAITAGDLEGYGLQWAYNDDENANSTTAVWTRQ
jgi:hypothetical protein